MSKKKIKLEQKIAEAIRYRTKREKDGIEGRALDLIEGDSRLHTMKTMLNGAWICVCIVVAGCLSVLIVKGTVRIFQVIG